MSEFTKKNASELKDFLFHSNTHDSQIQNIEYKYSKGVIKIELYNSFYNSRYEFTFRDVVLFLTTKGDWGGRQDTVSALDLEEDYSYLQDKIPEHITCPEDYLYLVLEAFSGDAIHILSKEVTVK